MPGVDSRLRQAKPAAPGQLDELLGVLELDEGGLVDDDVAIGLEGALDPCRVVAVYERDVDEFGIAFAEGGLVVRIGAVGITTGGDVDPADLGD
jgi:hypothetical protein